MTAAGGRAAPARGGLGNARGAAAVLVVLALPALVAATGFAVGIGTALVARQALRTAADLGALAGVQALDLDRLAAGAVVLREDQAAADARAWALENLRHTFGPRAAAARIAVRVYNTHLTGPVADAVTGRLVRDPTVCVEVALPLRIPFLSAWVGDVTLRAHADASVIPRTRWGIARPTRSG